MLCRQFCLCGLALQSAGIVWLLVEMSRLLVLNLFSFCFVKKEYFVLLKTYIGLGGVGMRGDIDHKHFLYVGCVEAA